MQTSRARNRIVGWMAMAALLLASLAPALSQAFGPSATAAWLEVCGAHGSKWIEASADDDLPASTSAHAFEHCPFCSIHAPVLGLPPSLAISLPPVDGARDAPAAVPSVERAKQAWASARPRGPPHRS